jgi:hypothetical protein
VFRSLDVCHLLRICKIKCDVEGYLTNTHQEGYERKCSLSGFKVLSCCLPWGTVKNNEKPQDFWSPAGINGILPSSKYICYHLN